MNPLHPIFAIVVYIIAFATAYLLNLKYKITNDNIRYETIDGMRGWLALGVFISHCPVWFQYLQTKTWIGPKSSLYNQLGETSVSLFFYDYLIFVHNKITECKKKIKWIGIFCLFQGFFRLVPMYVVSIVSVVLIVFIISNWELKVTLYKFLKEMFYWGTFTILNRPTINDYAYTHVINAGVVWSLPYEWLFYFSLPILSLAILKKRTPLLYIIISLLFIVVFCKYRSINQHHLLSFVGGAITPFLIKYGPKKN